MELLSKHTRFRAYQLKSKGASFSYFDGNHFTLCEARYNNDNKNSIWHELKMCGKSSIDIEGGCQSHSQTVSFEGKNSTTIVKEELYVFNISATGKVTVNTLFERDKQTIKFPALKGIRDSINFEKNHWLIIMA